MWRTEIGMWVAGWPLTHAKLLIKLFTILGAKPFTEGSSSEQYLWLGKQLISIVLWATAFAWRGVSPSKWFSPQVQENLILWCSLKPSQRYVNGTKDYRLYTGIWTKTVKLTRYQEVLHQRWISGNVKYVCLHQAWIGLPTLGLKPTWDLTRVGK